MSLEVLFQGLIAPTLIDCVRFAACCIPFFETALDFSGDEISLDVVSDPARRLRGWLFCKNLRFGRGLSTGGSGLELCIGLGVAH